MRIYGSSGSSSASAPAVFRSDNPLATPNVKSDTLTGTTLDAKWGTWNPAGRLTVTPRAGGVLLSGTAAGAYSCSGIYQALSADDEHDFSVFVEFVGTGANYCFMGLGLIQDPVGAPTTTDSEMLSLQAQAGFSCVGQWQAFTKFDTRSSFADYASNLPSGMWMRVRHKVSTKATEYYISSEGVGWRLVNSTTAAVTMGHLGLMISSWAATSAAFRNFTYSSAASGIIGTTPAPIGRSA